MSTLTVNRAKDALKAYYGSEEDKKKTKVKQAKKLKRETPVDFVLGTEPTQITGVN